LKQNTQHFARTSEHRPQFNALVLNTAFVTRVCENTYSCEIATGEQRNADRNSKQIRCLRARIPEALVLFSKALQLYLHTSNLFNSLTLSTLKGIDRKMKMGGVVKNNKF
jgi:hypothetical protein